MADEQGKTDRPEGQHGGPRTPSPFTVPKKGGARTVYEAYLDKNPQLKKRYLETLAKLDGPNPEPYNESDIANVDDLMEYTIFELTRSKNEGLLRGKTFTDYNRAMREVLELKVRIDNSMRIASAYAKAVEHNKEEVDAFYKGVCEVITQRITDEENRKQFIESVKKLYDEYYIQQKLIAERRGLQPPEKPGEPKL